MSKTKTVVIWDSCDSSIQFFVTDKDVSRFNRKYVNSTDCDDEMAEEISMLMYDKETGEKVIKTTEIFPVEEVRNGANVIVCGFLP